MIDEKLSREFTARISDSAEKLSYGISYLDDVLRGILPSDVVLIGAGTGRGKTELATLIAKHNASQGKVVHFFALEAEQDEIERRLRYAEFAHLFYSEYCQSFPGLEISYPDWRFMEYPTELIECDNRAGQLVSAKYCGNLNTIYRSDNYSVKDFLATFETIKHETDLVILDHIHYFDHDDDNELRALREATKAIRNAALNHNKAVIVLAHLRKSDRNAKTELPDINDFYGSSDLNKIATTAILLGTANGGDGTFFHVAKSRSVGQATRFVGGHTFNWRENKYSKEYLLYKHRRYDEPELLAEFPKWAKQVNRSPMQAVANYRKQQGKKYFDPEKE